MQKSMMPGVFWDQNHLRMTRNRMQVHADSMGLLDETPPRTAMTHRLSVTKGEVTDGETMRAGMVFAGDLMIPMAGIVDGWPGQKHQIGTG